MNWRDVGECIDKLRIVPRALLALYTWQAWQVGAWAMSRIELTVPQTVFVSTIYGVYPMLLNFYIQNGTVWSDDKKSTTVATQSVEVKQS